MIDYVVRFKGGTRDGLEKAGKTDLEPQDAAQRRVYLCPRSLPVAAGPWDDDPAVPEAFRTELYEQTKDSGYDFCERRLVIRMELIER